MAVRAGFALTGSFCTFSRAFQAMARLCEAGWEVTPIFSYVAAETDTRFGTAASFLEKARSVTGRKPVLTLAEAERFGPEKSFDLMIVAPCTASTCRRLADGLYDTPPALAVKAHLRNSRPVLLAIAANDALSVSAAGIGRLLPLRHYYFVPMVQDDPVRKPNSAVADFSRLKEAAEAALRGEQLRPLFLEPAGA